jgi:glycosyltransferase involved in cell wall biosynthesis
VFSKVKVVAVSVFLRFLVSQVNFWSFFFLRVVSKRDRKADGNTLLITGTFYSDNWLATHLRPLGKAKSIRRIIMVASTKVPEIEGVDGAYPGKLLTLCLGSTGARLVTFARLALSRRPEFIGGFHLLLNGLVAMLLSSATGAQSIYICGGGPREIVGGGYLTENRLFGMLEGPDNRLEQHLIRSVGLMNIIITMGREGAKFFRDHAKTSHIAILPGGLDPTVYYPAAVEPDIDVIAVGRLSRVKRMDRLLEAIAVLDSRERKIRVAIVGDGPLKGSLEKLASDYNLSKNVTFVGWTEDVSKWLGRSKLFVMTSDSEGLSQALIQATLCGLPAVVSDVGDLKDIVTNGENGYLIDDLTPENFAKKISLLLFDDDLRRRLGRNARIASEPYTIESAARQWDKILAAD